MPGTQTVTTVAKVFDEQGNEIDEALEHDIQPVEAATPAPVETDDPPITEGKYKIGDRSFATIEEAHTYATSQLATVEQEKLINDAYRQGISEALQHQNPSVNVTPQQATPEDDFNEEEYFANPKEFLKKFANKIKTETQAEFDARSSVKESGERVWREFTNRHPALADFRGEAEGFVSRNQAAVRAVIATKGQDAGYDYIALKLREEFSKYANAVKPKKDLPNGGGATPPANARGGVTPKTPVKKPLSMIEQIRSIKKKR
jgi:hypothetical protein